METSVNIGIFGLSPGWQSVLQQIGVPHEEITSGSEIEPTAFSTIIINRNVTNSELAVIQSYAADGGALIDTGFCIHKLMSGTYLKKYSTYLWKNESLFNTFPFIIDIYSQTLRFSSAQYLQGTVGINAYRNGTVCFLGLNPDTILFDARSCVKQFYRPHGRFPTEEVSKTDKGYFTRLIFLLLRHIHIRRNIPFVHKWFFPNGEKNVFLFRIDSDYGSKQQILKWHSLAEQHAIRNTWFLHTGAHEKWLRQFSEFSGHELAVHGHKHITTSNPKVLRSNINNASTLLSKNAISPEGYAAPYGLWSEAVNTICSDNRFLYSSEFSYGYDALPFYPVIGKKRSSVLQVPIHPICINSLINAKADEKDMVSYFVSRIHSCISEMTPCVLYDHVLHDRTAILEEIFSVIRSQELRCLTFSQYAKWWINRSESSASISWDNSDTLLIDSTGKECFYCVWPDEDSYILTKGENKNTISSLDKQKVRISHAVSLEEQKRTRKFNLRVRKNALLNKLFWRKYS